MQRITREKGVTKRRMQRITRERGVTKRRMQRITRERGGDKNKNAEDYQTKKRRRRDECR